MKKKLFLTGFFILSLVSMNGQVGVNTQNPQGIFHVDGAKDNNTTGAPTQAQQSNDFIVTAEGNVGIGTTTPTKKLEVVSSTSPAFRLNDGSQVEGYFMISDANGNGSWKSLTKTVLGEMSDNGYSGSVDNSSSTYPYLGVSITLPPGKWLVLTNIVLKADVDPTGGNGAWVRLQWSQTQGSSTTANITGGLNSGIFVAPYGKASGSTIINNTGSADKTYYLNQAGTNIFGGYSGNWDKLGANIWAENSVIAYPAN